ncbi:MAG: class I SAM-dependent rRNA methyltransferase [Truepera sp.]|nr:class I SAM-dependent rRNA methyltransferase [Truepera sp.]
MATVTITAKGVRRLMLGHPWIFDSDVVTASDTPLEPAVVRAQGLNGAMLGYGLYNPVSKIRVRMVTRHDQPVTTALFRERASAAINLRGEVAAGYEAFRVINSEADGLPGLTVDKYGPYLVWQHHAAALTPFLPAIVDTLQAAYQPIGILARNDAPVRALEGLPREVAVMHGTVPELLSYVEGGVTLPAAPYTGQKTGAFLDQRENHVLAGALSRGRALDMFSYHGGFALQLARRAEQVIAVDSSAAALSHLNRAAAANGLTNLVTVESDAFSYLRAQADAGERFDIIVLDPPAFAKGRDHLPAALAAYKEINLRALKLLGVGGRLCTASCSQHVSEADFQAMLRQAASDAGRVLRLVARRGQAPCHPELLNIPETRYLTFIAVEVIDVF